MMRIVAFAALVGAVKAGLTENGLACGTGAATAATCTGTSTPTTAFAAAYTPTCDLDAATDDTAECPTGCGGNAVAACTDTQYTDQTACETATETWNDVTCTGAADDVAEVAEVAWNAATCTGAADEVAEVAEVAGPTCEFTGDSCPATCDSTAAASATAESRLCEYPVVETRVLAEVAAATGTGAAAGCTDATECPCWGCSEFGTDPFSPMTADNTDEQIALAGKLTVMSPAASDACAEVCGMGAMNGPVVVAPVTSGDGVTEFTATASWCGLWADRQAGGVTCKESIFDAKPVLFLTIIGGALLIIFFQCSIMAVVALCADKPEVGDAKP